MRHRIRLSILSAFGLVGTLLVPGAIPVSAVVDASAPVFINELHYDNDGADVGEFIEVAGPAGTDLGGWTIELLNGSNGTLYATVALAGIVPDQNNGFGAVAFAQAGIQNGSPDGLALIDPGGTVVEFLSYEGSFNATAGTANGMTSTDIGVSEAGTTPAGQSLGKTGSGSLAGDFAWQAPAAESPGAVNAGQTFGAGPAAPPFIAEIHYDNDGGDVGEFFEIEGAAGTDLAGYSVVLYNGSNGASYNTIALTGTIDDEDGTSGALDFQLPANGLQNGSPDGIALIAPDASVIEFLSYEGVFNATDGPALGLTSVDIGVSEPGSTPIGQSLQLIDGTWTGPAEASPGDLNGAGPAAPPFISEIHYDNDGGDVGEFFEIEGAAGTDLTGYSVVLYNGSNGASYNTIALTGTIDDEDGTSGALDFQLPANGLQNGSPDGLALIAPDASVIEFLSYEGVFNATDGPATGVTSTDIGVSEVTTTPIGQSLQLLAGAWVGPVPESPGVLNTEFVEPPQLRLIHEVQGSGPVAALDGQSVLVQGVVTALFTRDDVLDGFFVQEEDLDADTDPATSEGVFIFCRFGAGCPGTVSAGDLVSVTGSVTEFFGMTQIDTGSGSIAIDSSGNPLPTPVPVDLPAAGRTDAETTFEAVEGMLTSFTETLAVSEYFNLARYGEVVLTAGQRPEQFTDANAPSVAGYAAFLDDLASRRIILDDDNNDQNDATSDVEFNEAYPWPSGGLSTTNFFRGGDTITALTGVLHWSFAGQQGTDAWRVRPVDGVDVVFDADNTRSATPDDVGGSLQVASFNVLNYFTTLDDGPGVCGPSGNLGCRGANSEAELLRQRDKIVAAMAAMDADILGLIEIENDDGAATQDLVDALNLATSPGAYAALDTGSIGTDAIKLALIYRPATVAPVGDFAILDSSVDPNFIDTKNRPALIQTFEEVASGARFTVAVNHLKSKGSACDDVNDPGLDDGQASCNLTRTAAAQALADYLATDPTGSGDGDFLIIGDLNSYAMEDPITALKGAGYTDLLQQFIGDDAYSYVFDGQLGYLDHALANDDMLAQVSGATVWHINADEISLLDYNDDIRDPNEASFNRESNALDIYDPDAYRSSDHDPVIIGLDLVAPGPTCNGMPATIIGTESGELIRGTHGDDVIVGLGGNDVIIGLGGNDVICGGSGNDIINAGSGDDIVNGEDGDDLVIGGGGDDSLSGDAGRDLLLGGRGADDISGGDDDDTLSGNTGDDVLDGGDGFDILRGGSGTDTCTTGERLNSCELPKNLAT